MKFQLNGASALLAAGAMVCGGAPFADAAGSVSAPWKNCTQVNKRYPHGVGKVRARDKTSGTPVTSFKRSNALYLTAMRNNRGLDRDKDGIACEKLLSNVRNELGRLAPPDGVAVGGKILLMQVYALTSTKVAGETLDLFLTKEAAEAELQEILEDEPEWVNVLRMVPIELDETEVSAN
jgi:hypothetical protein